MAISDVAYYLGPIQQAGKKINGSSGINLDRPTSAQGMLAQETHLRALIIAGDLAASTSQNLWGSSGADAVGAIECNRAHSDFPMSQGLLCAMQLLVRSYR